MTPPKTLLQLELGVARRSAGLSTVRDAKGLLFNRAKAAHPR